MRRGWMDAKPPIYNCRPKWDSHPRQGKNWVLGSSKMVLGHTLWTTWSSLAKKRGVELAAGPPIQNEESLAQSLHLEKKSRPRLSWKEAGTMRVPFSVADVTKFSLRHSKLLTGMMLFPGSLSVSIPGCPCVFFTVDHVTCHILCFQGQGNSRENGLWIQSGWWLWTLQVTGYPEERMVDWGLRFSGQSAYLTYTKSWIHICKEYCVKAGHWVQLVDLLTSW